MKEYPETTGTSKESFLMKGSFHDRAINCIDPSVGHIYDFMEQLRKKGMILIGHQTSQDIAEKILQNHEYFSETGLNGTSLIMNPETIAKTAMQQSIGESDNGITIHRSSNALVLIVLNKRDFPGARNLDTIDSGLVDYIEKGYLRKYGAPPQCIYGYISQNTLHPNMAWTGNVRHESEYI